MRILTYLVLIFAVALLGIQIGHFVTHTPVARPYSELVSPLVMIAMALEVLSERYVSRAKLLFKISAATSIAAAFILFIVSGITRK